MQFFCVHPAHVEQQQIGSEQAQFFQPGDIAHPVFQMRSDGFIAILTSMTDDADAALLSELAQPVQQVVGAGDRDANREPGLQAAVQGAFELGDHVVGANERLVGRLEEALGKIAHRGLTHVEHGAGDHPAHAAFSDGLCCLGAEIAAGIGKARGAGPDHLDLGKPRRAQRISFIHMCLDRPQAAE